MLLQKGMRNGRAGPTSASLAHRVSPQAPVRRSPLPRSGSNGREGHVVADAFCSQKLGRLSQELRPEVNAQIVHARAHDM